MYYVYILQLNTGNYYIGYSSNLKNRVKDHENGLVNQTKNFRPLKLAFYVAFISKTKAIHFETYLKTGSGFAFRNKHFI